MIFFDLETTGLNPEEDRIVEIAILDKSGKELFCSRINPLVEIPPEVSAIHGITSEDLKDCPTFKDVAEKVFDIIDGQDIAGYNSNSFDIPFLYNELLRNGIDWNYKNSNLIDVCNLYRIVEPHTLSNAYMTYTGGKLEGAHSAKEDTKATIAVFDSIINYYEVPKDEKELALFTNYGKEILDLSGKFVEIDGEVCFNFGKHKGKPVKSEKNYLRWMLDSDFSKDTKRIAKSLL